MNVAVRREARARRRHTLRALLIACLIIPLLALAI
jgi:hypothetical protein